jgi:hypothetical protein
MAVGPGSHNCAGFRLRGPWRGPSVRIPTKWPIRSERSGPPSPKEVAQAVRGKWSTHRSEATLG